MQLKGNDLSEWIGALVPVEAEAFKTMRAGTLIIRADSQTMQPKMFESYVVDHESGGDEWIGLTAPDGTHSELATLSGWFYYPNPVEEFKPILKSATGKVRELEGGSWTRLGVKDSW